MPKVNGLTLKQRKWREIYLETGNATEAARRAYPNSSNRSARQIGYENMTKLDFTDVLEAHGATLIMIVKGLAQGMDATKLIKANLIVQKGNNCDITGKQLIEAANELNGVYMEVADWAVRHRYLTTVVRLHRLHPGRTVKPKEVEPARITWKLSPEVRQLTSGL